MNGDAGVVTVTGSAFDVTAAENLLQAQFASWRSSGTAVELSASICAYMVPQRYKAV